jgi:hypothetical protein
VTNQIITMYLHCLTGDRPRSWLRWLPWAEFYYNTSYQAALKATPFHVVYGLAPLPMIPFQPGMTRVAVVDRQLQDRDMFLVEIKDQLLQARALMKTTHDKHHHGDWVWLCLNQRVVVTIHDVPQSKLASKYFDPYEVIGGITFWLQLSPKVCFHNIFHVAFLKKFESATPTKVPPLPPIVRGCVVPRPEQVVHARPMAYS